MEKVLRRGAGVAPASVSKEEEADGEVTEAVRATWAKDRASLVTVLYVGHGRARKKANQDIMEGAWPLLEDDDARADQGGGAMLACQG